MSQSADAYSHDKLPRRNNVTLHPLKTIKVAFVHSTFTDAAYNNAFYIFYWIHDSVRVGTNVTTDLNMLSAVIPEDTSSESSRADLNRLIVDLEPVLSNSLLWQYFSY